MNILCVIQRYYPVIGGSEILAKNFMDHLSKRHNVTIYTTTAIDIKAFWSKNAEMIKTPPSYNYEIKRCDFLVPNEISFDETLDKFPLPSSYPGPFSPQMWTDLVLKKINYDLIYVTAFPYDHIIPAYVAARKWKIPIIISPLIHQEFPELYLTAMRLTMLNNSNAIFVISESEKKLLAQHGIDVNKISVIPPVLSETLEDKIKPETFRKKFSIPNDTKIVLFIGSKSFVKGITHLIEAIKVIMKNITNVIVVLIGPTSKEFDEYFSTLSNEIREKIIDIGIVSDEIKKHAISSCDLLALPSKSESFGLVYLEAWLYGKPVIGCNISPISEIIDNNKNGILVDFGNIVQLSNAISLLLTNPSICQKYGENGKKKAELYNSKNGLNYFEEKCNLVVKEFKNKTHR